MRFLYGVIYGIEGAGSKLRSPHAPSNSPLGHARKRGFGKGKGIGLKEQDKRFGFFQIAYFCGIKGGGKEG